MKRFLTLAALAVIMLGSLQAQTTEVIGKQNIKLKSRMMTPEALWAMGRIGATAVSPDGQKVVYQVGYYSVKQNKSHQVLYVMNADGTGQQLLTSSAKSDSDPAWLDNQTIAFISGGEVWSMKANGADRQQLSKTDGKVEGFKFSPDFKQVILIQSIPFYEVIQKNPDDLPKATGRRVTDLMYRHWDHYVESIQHPYLAKTEMRNEKLEIISQDLVDILEGEPSECPMEPFGVLSNWHGVLTQRLSHTPVAKRWVSTMRHLPTLISICMI
jgi:dipeptidyl aminopeptidase/acylaminoacyl peptidase